MASRADGGDREDEWVRDMFTAHMHNEKISEELLAQTRTPQDAYEYAKCREKGIKHNRTMKTNPFGNPITTSKQEPIHYIHTRGRGNFANNQVPHKGRGNFRDAHILEVNKTHEISPNKKESNIITLKSNATNVVPLTIMSREG